MFGTVYSRLGEVDVGKRTFTFDVENDDDQERVTYILPMKWEVCSTCNGQGSHVNPSIDAHGITAEEWGDWDDEERDGYLTGRYDVPCFECKGRTTTLVVDEGACHSEEMEKALEEWKEMVRDDAFSLREREAEIRYGY